MCHNAFPPTTSTPTTRMSHPPLKGNTPPIRAIDTSPRDCTHHKRTPFRHPKILHHPRILPATSSWHRTSKAPTPRTTSHKPLHPTPQPSSPYILTYIPPLTNHTLLSAFVLLIPSLAQAFPRKLKPPPHAPLPSQSTPPAQRRAAQTPHYQQAHPGKFRRQR